MSRHVGRYVRGAVLACALLLGATACGGNGEGRTDGQAPAEPERSPAGGSSVEVSPLEKYLDLPIAEYAFSSEELDLISRAEWKLTRDCMRKHELTYDLKRAEQPAAYEPGSNRRYGVLNAAIAERYGYHFPEAQSPVQHRDLSGEELLALNGRPNDTVEVNGRKVPEGGCIGLAKTQIRGKHTYAKGADAAGAIAGDSFAESLKSPEVLEVTRDWAQCMKGRGFSYDSPLQALGAAENSGEQITKREISVATADIDCKVATGLVKTWSAVESEYQRDRIAKERKELKLLAESHRKVLSEARSVLG